MSSSTALDHGLDLSSYQFLPVDPDEGFPQSFLVAVGANTYRTELYVNVAEHLLPGWPPNPRTLVDVVGDQAELPVKGSLVAVVARQEQERDIPVLRRRLLPGIAHSAGDLRLVVVQLRIALGNLNSAGSFGSIVKIRMQGGPR